MLGMGGGNGIKVPKAKIIIVKPKPVACIDSIKSRIKIRSEELLFTTSSMTWVVMILSCFTQKFYL